jgi:hypothetical protein
MRISEEDLERLKMLRKRATSIDRDHERMKPGQAIPSVEAFSILGEFMDELSRKYGYDGGKNGINPETGEIEPLR